MLITTYHEVTILEKNINHQRLMLMDEFIDVYNLQNETDVCLNPNLFQSININGNIFKFEFDNHNQLINVVKK